MVEFLIQDSETCQTLHQLEPLAGCAPQKGIAAVSVSVTGAADVSLKLPSLWPPNLPISASNSSLNPSKFPEPSG